MGHRNRSRQNLRLDSNPTPSEIVAARTRAKLDVAAAAKLVYATVTEWQDWENPSHPRQMRPGLFELFLIKTGQHDPQSLPPPKTGG